MALENRLGAIRTFIVELSRRRVFRVAALYSIVGWLITEVSATVLPALNLPDWSVTLVVMLLALGFPVALALSWALDIGPDGIHRTSTVDAGTTAYEQDAPPSAQPGLLISPIDPVDPRRSIAVLPFVNMSGDRGDEYFADGVSEEILQRLAKLPQVRVASRSSSFAFKKQRVDIPAIASRLGVGTVLDGSVRRVGKHLRLTAQLIDAATDSSLWAETYDRQLTDILDVQADIARRIVEALQVELTAQDRRALECAGTLHPQAYDQYLRGRGYFYSMTTRGFHYALGMYAKAIELDPGYARAYSGIADCYSSLFMYGDSTAENLREAAKASRKAIELEPELAEARVSRGMALSIAGRHEEAESEFERALLVSPRLFEAYYLYARDSLAQGKSAKAARLFAQASQEDPTDYQAPHFLGLAYEQMGQLEDARAAHDRAAQIIRRHLEIHPDDVRALSLGAASLAATGRDEHALTWARRAAETDKDEPTVLYNIACVYSKLGQTDEAIALLERAIAGGFVYRAWLENDPDLAPLRSHERFQSLVARLG